MGNGEGWVAVAAAVGSSSWQWDMSRWTLVIFELYGVNK